MKAAPMLACVIGGIVSAVAVVGLGLRVQPGPFPDPAPAPGPITSMALPADLPAPVARFYSALYEEEIPVIGSAIISGRGRMRIAGLTLPVRFRFSHISGQGYRHHIETTIFGAPLLRVDERFIDGTARLELPFGVSEGPQVDQGANLALWAEAVWMPSLWLTDSRVGWEAIDQTSARLHVPFGQKAETFTVTFDTTTGLLSRMESMRFKGATDTERTLWINEVLEWGELDGRPLPLVTTLTWADEGSPWAVLRTEDMVMGADLTSYIGWTGA